MKYDYKSIIEEIKKRGNEFLRSEKIGAETFFIEGIEDVSAGKGIIIIKWYWSKDLLKLALGFKEYSMREVIVELLPGKAEKFSEQFNQSLDYTLTEVINQVKEATPEECAPILEEVQAFVDKYDKALEDDNFSFNNLVDLIHEWNKVTYSLITISLAEVYDDYNKVIDHLEYSADIYIEEIEEENESDTIHYDLEDLKEKLLNC